MIKSNTVYLNTMTMIVALNYTILSFYLMSYFIFLKNVKV
jgi:hypothetical protein